jgi:hypothetical protein
MPPFVASVVGHGQIDIVLDIRRMLDMQPDENFSLLSRFPLATSRTSEIIDLDHAPNGDVRYLSAIAV